MSASADAGLAWKTGLAAVAVAGGPRGVRADLDDGRVRGAAALGWGGSACNGLWSVDAALTLAEAGWPDRRISPWREAGSK